jgi:hypothetical protein
VGHDGERVGQAFGHVGGAVNGIECDIETGRVLVSSAELVAEKDARSLVLDSFADNHLPADIDQIEDTTDRIASSLVGSFLVPSAKPVDGVQRGVLGGTDKFEFDGALDVWQVVHGESFEKL